MFIITSTYLKSFDRDEPVFAEHMDFVNKHYADGTFIAFGSRQPRVGGIIIARGTEESEIRTLMAQDPFVREGISEYEYTQCRMMQAAHPDMIEA